MKVVQINSTCGVGSTGKICVGISKILTENAVENYILYSSKTNGYCLGIDCATDRYIKVQSVKSRILGNYGFNSRKSTLKMIRELERINPDVVHLHNIHSHDCNLEMLFSYFRQKKTKLVWTFHDCWAFTGYCTHFSIADCDKWKNECSKCIQSKRFSFFFDRSKSLFDKKKQLFEGLDLTVVTPSQWLAGLVKESIFKECSVKVIYNGIDLSVFQPKDNRFKEENNISDSKKIVLGVAFDWGYQKGIDVCAELAKDPDFKKYQIVLVGDDRLKDIDLPDDVILIPRTRNQAELAEIYTAADVFVNPTREEVLGLTNIEANACGTPVITFRTGGSPECIDFSSGVVVDTNDIDSLKKEIVRVCEDETFVSAKCCERAQKFNEVERFKEYIELYEAINAR